MIRRRIRLFTWLFIFPISLFLNDAHARQPQDWDVFLDLFVGSYNRNSGNLTKWLDAFSLKDRDKSYLLSLAKDGLPQAKVSHENNSIVIWHSGGKTKIELVDINKKFIDLRVNGKPLFLETNWSSKEVHEYLKKNIKETDLVAASWLEQYLLPRAEAQGDPFGGLIILVLLEQVRRFVNLESGGVPC